MSTFTLYHGTDQLFDRVDLSFAGRNWGGMCGEAGPELYVSAFEIGARKWVLNAHPHAATIVILKTDIDRDNFCLLRGLDSPAQVIDGARLTVVMDTLLAGREEETMIYLNSISQGRPVNLPVGEATADYLLRCKALIDSTDALSNSFLYQLYDLFLKTQAEHDELQIWCSIEELFKKLDIDAIDIYSDGEEIAIYRGALEKMPEWRLHSYYGHKSALPKVGLSLGDVVIGAGNAPPLRGPTSVPERPGIPSPPAGRLQR